MPAPVKRRGAGGRLAAGSLGAPVDGPARVTKREDDAGQSPVDIEERRHARMKLHTIRGRDGKALGAAAAVPELIQKPGHP